jgi:hypothetical protein
MRINMDLLMVKCTIYEKVGGQDDGGCRKCTVVYDVNAEDGCC